MCTVSWLHDREGYQLFCNRDERHTRRSALPPALGCLDGVQYVAPIDRDGRGSWLLVNEFGVTLALLNRPSPGVGSRSRGLLLTSLASQPSLRTLSTLLARTDLSPYAGFALVAIAPSARAQLFEWDGNQLSHVSNAEHCMPVTSSSVDQSEADRRRKAEFEARFRAARGLSEHVLSGFHQSHGLFDAPASAYSACMHRADASTVSFSWVRVRRSEIEMFYSPGPPCQWSPGQTLVMERSGIATLACG